MKYCVSNRQPKQLLEKADEIKVQYSDIARIKNYIEDYPNKSFVYEIPKNILNSNIEWSKIKEYAEKADFKLAIKNLNLATECHNRNISFYWDYPVFTYYELRSLIKLNPCYIILNAPLFFDLENVNKITKIPIRLSPNLAYDAYIPKDNGIYGTWIRPEDVDNYSKYVNILEFVGVTTEQEATLFHIYQENKTYPGNLNFLFTNFNYHVDNRSLPEDLGIRRMTCGQRCMVHGTCHYCETIMNHANLIKKLHNLKKEQEEEKLKESID